MKEIGCPYKNNGSLIALLAEDRVISQKLSKYLVPPSISSKSQFLPKILIKIRSLKYLI